MNFLVIGDVVGRSGRNALQRHLPDIKKKFHIDFTIINGENSAAGYGITGKIYEDFINWGADAITLGNHAWKKDEIIPYMENNPDHSIIRPLNFPDGSPPVVVPSSCLTYQRKRRCLSARLLTSTAAYCCLSMLLLLARRGQHR